MAKPLRRRSSVWGANVLKSDLFGNLKAASPACRQVRTSSACRSAISLYRRPMVHTFCLEAGGRGGRWQPPSRARALPSQRLVETVAE